MKRLFGSTSRMLDLYTDSGGTRRSYTELNSREIEDILNESDRVEDASPERFASTSSKSLVRTAFTKQDRKLQSKLSRQDSVRHNFLSAHAEMQGNRGRTWYEFLANLTTPIPVTNWYSRKWIQFITICSLISVFWTPYRLAFEHQRKNDFTNASIFELLIDYIFITNLVLLALHIVPAELFYILEDEDLVNSTFSWKIRLKISYFRFRLPKYYFKIVSAIPWDFLVTMLYREYISSHVLFALGMVRVFRFAWVYSAFMEAEKSVHLPYYYVRMFKFFLLFVVEAHYFACIFFFVGINEQPYTSTWLYAVDVQKPPDELDSPGKRYLLCLYWAFVTIATIGFGDISPQTDKEFMLFIAFVMLNIFLTAWVLGNVTLLVTQNDESTRLFREKFVHLEKYMKTHYLPEEMRDTLRDYMKLQYNMAGEHREALDLFPNVFKSTVNRFLFRPIIDSSFLKSITSDNFRDSLASEMTLELLMPDTDIITQFDTSHEMYIIASGTVQVFLDVDAQEFETKTSEPLDTLSECPDDEEADGSDDDDNNEDDDEKHELTVNEKACSMREGSISSKRESGIEMLPRTDLRSTSAESAYSAKHASKFASRYGSIDLAALDDDDDDQSGYSSPRSPKGGFVRPPLHKQGTMKLLLDVVETITNVVEDETEVEIEKAAASQKQKKQEKISIGTLTDGACIGEVPFLFKLQQPLHIRTKTICRLLVLKRDSWNSLRAVHPFDSRQVVLNVAQRVKTESFEFEGNGHHEPRDRGFFGSGKGASCHHDHHDHHDTPDGTNPSHPQSPLPPPCHSKDNIEDMQKRSALHEMYKTLSDLVSNELAISEKDQVAELCYAAVAGNVFTMRQILSSADFSVNNSDYDGRTALHAASAKGVTISVKYLLERRADVNCLDNFGVTPLFEAVRNGHEEVARLLFKHGGNLGLTDANHTVLDIKKQMDAGSLSCLVASRDDAEHLDRLLRYGLNPNACDYDGRTGLHIAAALGNHSIMEVFLKYGANPSSLDYFGRTPLLEAVRAQQEPCCRLLMSKGGELGLLASLEDRKESCGTPRRRLSINPTLLRSMSIDRDSASTAGKSKSSPKKSPGKGSGMTTVIDHKKTRMLAGLELCMAAYEDDTRYLRTLLQFGCPVNSSDYDGRTAAHICCAGNLLSPALTLIDFGADFNSGYIKDRWGRTPLEEAYLNNHHELASTIESLLKLKLREGSYVDDERSDTKSNEGKDTRSNDGTSVDGNGAPRRPSVPLMRPPQELLGKEQSPPVKLKKKGSTGTLRKLFSNNK